MTQIENDDPHGATNTLFVGDPKRARVVLVAVHGRGATAESILTLFDELNVPDAAACAPQAFGNTWYLQSFLAPIERNQPYLDSALRRLGSVVRELSGLGIPKERVALLGFSQGACLTLEFAARNAARWGAVIGLTGGLIGPDGTPREHRGSFDGTPVFLGSSDPDPHVPFERVRETAQVLTGLGAAVRLERYPGMPHTVNREEIDIVRQMLSDIAGPR